MVGSFAMTKILGKEIGIPHEPVSEPQILP